MAKLFFAKKAKKKKLSEIGWKILIADDDESVHQVTKLALKHFDYQGRKLNLISAFSGQEAMELMRKERDIAIVLLDVVMETENAGLEVVEYIRNILDNSHVRIILRTGQPGYAPERYVIDHYDINDYKEKTELSQDKLYTSIRMGLKSFEYITILNSQKRSLEYIVQAAPAIFKITTLEDYFRSILNAIIDLLGISEGHSKLDSLAGFIAYPVTEDGEYKICYGIDNHGQWEEDEEKIAVMLHRLHPQLDSIQGVFNVEDGTFAIPIKDKNEIVAAILLENLGEISEHGKRLLNILSMQASSAFKNIDLFELISREHQETINLLAVASEYKDEDTGEHIRRIENVTRLLALELGMSETYAVQLGQSSTLHDIGKLSVPDSVLQKPGKLTSEEFEVIKLHTLNGEKILAGHGQFELASSIARSHHEHYDGSGYPEGAAGDDIPICGRITALADVYDALSNERPYKGAWPKVDVLNLVRCERGRQFDPDVVDAFFRLIDKGVI
ncbi:MAG: HD domain-containing phosphohydrolase [Candidatus Thiodiazotropha sp. (ex. Lucinoma kazani)]